jgi:hypothetical protein
MKTCESIVDLARELKVQRKLLYTWKYQFEGRPEPRRANLAQTAEERKEKQLMGFTPVICVHPGPSAAPSRLFALSASIGVHRRLI